jgi:fumarate hydratase class II
MYADGAKDCPLALGGTAVGTGINAPAAFGEIVARKIAEPPASASCGAGFSALSAHDAMVNVSAALRTLGGILANANDVRWYATGRGADWGA